MHCPDCGRPTPDRAPACPHCGYKLDSGDPAGGQAPLDATQRRGGYGGGGTVRIAQPSSRATTAPAAGDATAVLGTRPARTALGLSSTQVEQAVQAAGQIQQQAAAVAGPARTLVGMPNTDLQAAIDAARAAAAQVPTGGAARTVVGLATPRVLAESAQISDTAATLVREGSARELFGVDPGVAPRPGEGPARTLLGGVAPMPRMPARLEAAASTLVGGTPSTRSPAAYAPPGAEQPARTLLGVARPGIAPLAPGMEEEELAPVSELGMTMGPSAIPRMRPPGPKLDARDVHRRAEAPRAQRDPKEEAAARDARKARERAKAKAKPKSKRGAIIVASAAGGLVLVAVGVGLLWTSSQPVSARPKTDEHGREGVEFTCNTCPEGTKLTVFGASAITANHVAQVPLATDLRVGENRLKVAVERPGKAAETMTVAVHVGYRVRPDLGTLQGDRPAITVTAEAEPGTTVTLDGKAMALVDGRGVEKLDVLEALTGLGDDVKTLSRQVPYVVTPPDAPPSAGVVAVSVGIVPLHVDAPGPRVTTDVATFVLAGHTVRGAEVLAAGRPIPVKPDGTFAQVMNVSSVGATQIEVRAKLAGLAPRIVPIRVRRVENLDVAAREFAAESPVDWSVLANADKAQIGKPILLAGEVVEARRQGFQTIVLLDVAKTSGCPTDKGCTARLVVGGEVAYKKGDKIRAFGRIGAPFAAVGKEIAEVEVEFSIRDGAKGKP